MSDRPQQKQQQPKPQDYTDVKKWYVRLATKLGLTPGSKEWNETRNTYGKHRRGSVKARNFDAKRKTRRKMAKQSRRINRKA